MNARWLSILALLVMGSCKGGTGSDRLVGPEGGTVSSSDGDASVDVPPGAVHEDVSIIIEEVESPVPLPEWVLNRGAVYAFEPHGQIFDLPVTITLPHTGDPAAPLVVLRLDDAADTTWETGPEAEFTPSTATFETTSFSYYQVGEVPEAEVDGVDILFVVDNSGSMTEEQASLANNFYRFVNVLENLEGGLPDLHIGVISTDVGAGPFNISGCTGNGDNGMLQSAPSGACEPPSGAFISDVDDGTGGRTTNYAGTLEDTFSCIVRLGIDGCGFEQPLESMRRALNGSNPTNAGFLRDNALLAVFLITDEDDCSTADTNMFDTAQNSISDPLGPLSSFRCFEFGVVCDPDNPRTPGPRQDCRPRDDSAYMHEVDDYVDFLASLKSSPSMVVVSGIIGNPTPVIVGVNDQENPELEPSCSSTSGEAVPGVRLGYFLEQFPQRNSMSTICNEDLSDALVVIATQLAELMDPN